MIAPKLMIERFSFSKVPAYTGSRGTVVKAEDFPPVFVSDNGMVELEDIRYDGVEIAAWLRAIADHIDTRLAENAREDEEGRSPERDAAFNSTNS